MFLIKTIQFAARSNIDDSGTWSPEDGHRETPAGMRLANGIAESIADYGCELDTGPEWYEEELVRLEISLNGFRFEVMINCGGSPDDCVEYWVSITPCGLTLRRRRELRSSLLELNQHLLDVMANLSIELDP
tara:strand:+ start:10693 stop:11088 length:396 start_codon:yes stop_codon:yes gene_type:complete